MYLFLPPEIEPQLHVKFVHKSSKKCFIYSGTNSVCMCVWRCVGTLMSNLPRSAGIFNLKVPFNEYNTLCGKSLTLKATVIAFEGLAGGKKCVVAFKMCHGHFSYQDLSRL